MVNEIVLAEAKNIAAQLAGKSDINDEQMAIPPEVMHEAWTQMEESIVLFLCALTNGDPKYDSPLLQQRATQALHTLMEAAAEVGWCAGRCQGIIDAGENN